MQELAKEDSIPITFPEPIVMTAAEALERMDKVTHRVLQCSADDFLRGWDAGVYRSTDSSEIAELAILIPFVR